MKIILLSDTCKYHKLVFATELDFCDHPKPNPMGFLSREPVPGPAHKQ